MRFNFGGIGTFHMLLKVGHHSYFTRLKTLVYYHAIISLLQQYLSRKLAAIRLSRCWLHGRGYNNPCWTVIVRAMPSKPELNALLLSKDSEIPRKWSILKGINWSSEMFVLNYTNKIDESSLYTWKSSFTIHFIQRGFRLYISGLRPILLFSSSITSINASLG